MLWELLPMRVRTMRWCSTSSVWANGNRLPPPLASLELDESSPPGYPTH
jgi:hypothetical protein